MLKLDQIQTVALAGLVLFVGYGIRRLIPVLAKYNMPAPVIGGLLVAGLITAARGAGYTLVAFDTSLQSPLMIAFFTSIGFGASVSLLRIGGPAVLAFFLASTVMAVVQNVLGAAASVALGQHPLMGVLAGSVTLTGGPATGLAFAPLFEQAGVPGAGHARRRSRHGWHRCGRSDRRTGRHMARCPYWPTRSSDGTPPNAARDADG